MLTYLSTALFAEVNDGSWFSKAISSDAQFIQIDQANCEQLIDQLQFLKVRFNKIEQAILDCVRVHITETVATLSEKCKMPEPLLAACLDVMCPEQVWTVIPHLSNPSYHIVCTSQKQPAFPINEATKQILDYLAKQSWISSYAVHKKSRTYRAFPKKKR